MIQNLGRFKNAPPLNGEEVEHAAALARRIKAELRRLFDTLPAHARTGTGLARYLDLDRGTCTRFVNVCRKTLDELDVLRQLPGVKGLQQVFDALEKTGVDRGDLDAGRVATEQFERLLQEMGGSQTKLTERIDATAHAASMSDEDAANQLRLERRRQLYEAAVQVTGHHIGLRVVTQIFRPTPDKPGRMDQGLVRGMFGHFARPGAMPYAIQSFGATQTGGADEPAGERALTTPEGAVALGLSGEAVLPEFSSNPVPLVSTRGSGRYAVTCIDPTKGNDQGNDIVMAHAVLGDWGLPQHDDPPIHEVSTNIKHPCERLLLDVYLHRSLAAISIPSAKAHITSPGLFTNLLDHWFDELPDSPRLQLLGSDPANLPSRFYDRHPELVRTVFDRLSWNFGDFVGFRCEIEYPIWCGYYTILFDYRSA